MAVTAQPILKTFNATLADLPTIDHLAGLILRRDDDPTACASIENRPGQAGSLAVYHQLYLLFGVIDARAAAHGIALYAEHTDDARAHPGKHPNIDRLLQLIDGGGAYRVELQAV